MLSPLSDIDPCGSVVIGLLAVGVHWLWNRLSDPKYEEAQARSKTALDSLRTWAEKHHIEHQIDKLQVDFRRNSSEKGHPIFNLDMVTILVDALKELLVRLKVEYTPEDMKKMIENLRTIFSGKPWEILENMVVDLSQTIPDFSREVCGIFRPFLVQAITDYMEDHVKNNHSNSRKKLTKHVNELVELMIQHEVFIDTMARDEWLLNGSRSRQEEEEDQVYQTPEGREAVYRRMREVWNRNMKDILGNLKKILGKIKLAYQNGLDVYYYWA